MRQCMRRRLFGRQTSKGAATSSRAYAPSLDVVFLLTLVTNSLPLSPLILFTSIHASQNSCSNAALVLAFVAVIIGIVPQTTCSFLTINPTNITSYPNNYPPPAIGPEDIVKEAVQTLQQQQEAEDESGFGPWTPVSEEVENYRNITETPFTINIGPWLVGSDEIDGVCYPISSTEQYGAPPPDPSLLAARAFGIVASVAGSAAFVWGMINCHLDDKTRRRRNRCVALLYGTAAIATWLTFLIANIGACQGAERTWIEPGPLQGLSLQYGRCICRAGCFLTIVVGCCYMAAMVCVLLYSG